ncbi:MAG: type II toxin-antitoxin system death-on-curing family toxin [Bacteroidetes bacterium]|nr:type II toxin-antitoxin system death-on-curing family toxin [Bacteroidota bacterium]
MIDLREVQSIHEILIDKFGGTKGTRDMGALESAINRPYQTFDGKELYPLPEDRAAAIFESLISNHPFIDGNKRIAYVLMRIVLKQENVDIKAEQEEKYAFVITAAKGELTFDQIRTWIKNHMR